MPVYVELTCITKENLETAHERIHAIGGLYPNGRTWRLSEDDAIASIKAEKWRFWTYREGKMVWVVIEKTDAGHEYLKAQSDGDLPTNLLWLPECK